MTVITETALSPEIDKMIKDPAPVKENPNLSFAPEQKIFSPIEVAEKVKVLLQQYKDYMDMDAEKAQLESEYAHTPTQELANAIDELKLKLDKLGDDMKFDNPLIWLGYKRLAYANNPAKKVGTI